MDPLTYLDLFAGVSMLGLGFESGLEHLGIRAQCVCHVEREIYAAGVLAARMQDGSLPEAPVWSDVRTFDGKPYRGYVDAIIGGFPCQDLSVAGKQAGIDGEKSGLWREYARIIREVRPRLVFVENVPGLLANGAMGRVLGDLAALGCDAEWGVFSASGVGAPHKRERVFILAYSNGGRCELGGETYHRNGHYASGHDTHGCDQVMEHAQHGGSQGRRPSGTEPVWDTRDANLRHEVAESGGDVAVSQERGFGIVRESSRRDGFFDGGGADVDHADCAGKKRSGRAQPCVEAGCRAVADCAGGSGQLDDSARDERDRPLGEGGRRRGVCEAMLPMADTSDRPFQEPWRGPEGRTGTGPAGAVLGHAAHAIGRRGVCGEEAGTRAHAIGRRGSSSAGCELADPSDGQFQEPWRGPEGRTGVGSAGAILGHAASAGREEPELDREWELSAEDSGGLDNRPERSSGELADTEREGLEIRSRQRGQQLRQDAESLAPGLFPPGPGDREAWARIPEHLAPAVESGLRVLLDGTPLVVDASRTDQLRCGGNGVVALTAAVALVELMRRAGF